MAGLALAACGETDAEREYLRSSQAVVDEYVRSGRITPAEGQWVMATVKAKMDANRRQQMGEALAGIGASMGNGLSSYGAAYTQTYNAYRPVTTNCYGTGRYASCTSY
jgi:hypothetical protein